MKNIIKSFFEDIHEHITGVKPPPGFLASFVILILLLVLGTIFYANVEKWSYLDSLYFSVATVATVGYGDLHPTNPASKVFTIIYIFMGVGLALYIFTTFSGSLINGKEKQIKKLEDLLRRSEEGRRNVLGNKKNNIEDKK